MQPDRRTLHAATADDDRASAAAPHAEPRPPGDEAGVVTVEIDGWPVICAIDDDGLAPCVLATGAALAERLDVPLTVVHSPHPSVFVTGEAYRRALERGNALVYRLADGYRVDKRVVEVDEPGRLISNLAREGASMVVLGTRRRTGWRAAILGSVSHAVIASAPCPVLTVSQREAQGVERMHGAPALRHAAA